MQRWKKVSAEGWKTCVVNKSKVNQKWKLKDGTVMFPTTHDIVPSILDDCIVALDNMLVSGNKVLIVSKPHIDCIEKICDKLVKYKNQILFRFTIGALDDKILGYWEPDAPTAEERMESLKLAHADGFSTSVSMEPTLDWPSVVSNFKKMAPYVTNSIWIGTMNFVDKRVVINTDEDKEMVDKIKRQQTLQNMKNVYASLKDHPLTRWKGSIKEALDLDIPDEVGLDI